MDFRKRREEETYAAATFIVVSVVGFAAVVMMSLAVEILFFPTNNCWYFGRFTALRLGGRTWDDYLILILGQLVTFGAGLVSKRIDRVFHWRVIVYVSTLGLAASLLTMVVFVKGSPALNHIISDPISTTLVPHLNENNLETDILNVVQAVCVSTAIWFGGQIAVQFGLKMPVRE